jgi:hypothetical protein
MNRASATTSPFATHWIRPLRIMLIISMPSGVRQAFLKEPYRFDLTWVRFFDNPTVLFNDIVEILALTQKSVAGESSLGFQGFHYGRIARILIHVNDLRDRIGG